MFAVVLAGAGDADGARRRLETGLDAFRALGAGVKLWATFAAVVAFQDGHPARSSRLLSWVRSRTFDVGRILPSPDAFAMYEHYVRLVRSALTKEQAQRYRDEGREMSEDEAIACALESVHE